ncbi:hypothetical protein HYW17_00880 [Candidatus Uhrbacteria bacterium]|nr:hypothetical protein [Candidatus Uhrbacteria bacterium]
MRVQKKLFRDAARMAADLSADEFRGLLLEGVTAAYAFDGEDVRDALVDYLMREITRRAAKGAPRGETLLKIWDDLERIKVHTPAGRVAHVIPVDLLIDAEGVGLDLRDVLAHLTALHQAIRAHFPEPERLLALQIGITALKIAFEKESDGIRFAQVLRADARTVQLAVRMAIEHPAGHIHDQELPIALANTDLTERLWNFASALPSALPAAAMLRLCELRHGEITALTKYFSCAHCLLELALRIASGQVSAEIVRELARNAPWLSAQAVPLDTVRDMLEWRARHKPPFDLRATCEVARSIADVVANPGGLETLLRYSADPSVLRAAGLALRTHNLTLTWLVAGYRDCEPRITFAQYVKV